MAKSCLRCSWHSAATVLILQQSKCHFPQTAFTGHWNCGKALLVGTHLHLSVISQMLCTAFWNNTHSLPHGNTLKVFKDRYYAILTHWKRPWCWERLKAGGEGDDRGWWDGGMASPTRWTWLWLNSGSWWWTGRPGMLQCMGLQRVGHDWVTELNWLCHPVQVKFDGFHRQSLGM